MSQAPETVSAIERLTAFLTGPVTLQCPSMTLLTGDFEPVLARGEGTFEVVSETEFRFSMTGLPENLAHSLAALKRQRDDCYNGLYRFRLQMTDADGQEWSGGWTVPAISFEDDFWILSGEAESLSCQLQGPATGEGGAEARFLVPRAFTASMMMQRFVRTPVDSAEASASRVISVAGVPVTFAFDRQTSVLSISAPSAPPLLAHHAENWLGEPLRILFGQLVYPRLVERRFADGRSMLWVRPSPPWRVDSAWAALWIEADRVTNDQGFFELYAGLLSLIAQTGEWESHTVTSFYVEVIQAARGSRWVMAMTLASSIEGLARLLIPTGTLRADADQAGIDSLVAHINQWTGTSARLKAAAVNAVKRADVMSVNRALLNFAAEGVGARGLVESWLKVRNRVMHGELVSPYSSQDEDQIIVDLADLLRALTREAARRALQNPPANA